MSRSGARRTTLPRRSTTRTRKRKFTAERQRHWPFRLVSRQPDVKTIWKMNDQWWGKQEGNVTSVTYSSIKNDATRLLH